jgi:hypothetical protein
MIPTVEQLKELLIIIGMKMTNVVTSSSTVRARMS